MVNISIVTGASSGLGRDMAKLLCKEDHIVYAIARSKDKLLELQKECSKEKGKIKIISGDLTDYKFRKKLINQILRQDKKIDYLINNAGFGKLASLENTELKDIEGMYALNSIALQHLTQLVIPSMKKNKKGRIINIASVVVFTPPVYFTTYNATKYAVYGFSRTLMYELYNTGVSVSVAFPSRMKTGFWKPAFKTKRLNEKEQKLSREKFSKIGSSSLPVAKHIVKKLDTKRFHILPGFMPRLGYYLLRHIYFIGDWSAKRFMIPNIKKLTKEK